MVDPIVAVTIIGAWGVIAVNVYGNHAAQKGWRISYREFIPVFVAGSAVGGLIVWALGTILG